MKRFVKAGTMFALALITAASVIFCAVPTNAASTVTIPVSDPRIETATVTPAEPGVGSPFDVQFDFTHDSNEINSIYTQISYVKINVTSQTGSISVSQKQYKIDSNSIDDNDNVITFKLYIPQKYLKRTGNGYGILKFQITYYDSHNEKIEVGDKKVSTFTVEKLVFGKLSNSSKKDSDNNGRLIVQSFKLDHSPIKEGQKFGLTLTVKNNGSVPFNHVISVITPPEGVSVNGVTDTKPMGTLAAGATVNIAYPLVCLPKMTTGDYAATITLSSDEMDTPAAPKIYIPITGTKTNKDDVGGVGESKPQIIIESYDYGGQAVTGGKEFTLSMNVKNTGATAIENVKMTVSSVEANSDSDKGSGSGGAFTPSKSSNTFFIKKLAAGSIIKKQIALLPKSDASPKSYGVGIAFKYEAVVDKKRQSLDATETISIPLTQPDRFEVNDVGIQDECYVGQPGQFTANYVNKGKSKIFNLSVVLDGNFTTSEKNTYIGNIDSGASDNFEATITPKKEGPISGTVTFSYEDSIGTVKKIKKEFAGKVSSMEDMKGGMEDMDSIDANAPMGKEKKGGIDWKIWVGGAVGVVVIIIVLKILLKKRKAKKIRMLEESDDYEDEPGGGKEI